MSSIEALVDHQELNLNGIKRASPLHGQDPNKSVIERILFRALNRKSVLVGLHIVRAIGGAVLVLTPDRGSRANLTRGSIGAFLTLSEGSLSLYNRYGSDGADQAAIQALGPAALARLSRNQAVEDAAVWYTGLQGVLSYSVAGVAKLFGKEWQRGTAIKGIVRTNAYGHEKLWKLLKRHPKLSKIATWGTVAWEVSYPLALLPIPVVTKSYTASAMVFHFLNAHFMGLGRFAWAFASLHPAINTIAAPSKRMMKSSFPRSAVFSFGITCLVLAVSAMIRHYDIRSLPFGWSRVRVPSGNSLAVKYRHGGMPRLVIFESGLGAPIETYQWFYDAFCNTSDLSFLMYERAGYGASTLSRSKKHDWNIELAVDDLESLVLEFGKNHQEVILIGHSMGGEIIRRLSNRRPDLVDLLVLIDSTNINQFVDGSLSKSDIYNLRDSFRIQRNRTLFGLGGIMNATPPSKDLPHFVRKRGISAERNHRLWTAALREYTSLLARLPDEKINLFHHAIPRLGYSAQTTMDLKSTRNLQNQLFEDGTNSLYINGKSVETVSGRHDTMFTVPANGIELARKILEGIG